MGPRVLMLPGYTQSASILRGRMGAIRKALGTGPDSPELIFVDPTFIVNLPTTSSADFDSTADSTSANPADQPRTWWFAEPREDGFSHFKRFDETLVYLRDIMEKQGPFDGVWGFSQGGAMAAILTLLVENPALHPVFAAPSSTSSTWPPPQFKFSVLAAGFLPMDKEVRLARSLRKTLTFEIVRL
ncbi:hypothetical protein T439DRAFT_320307 [Meredithblackwellia eburnea MCA 4105]